VLFILPAMLLVYAFAWAHVRYGTLPAAEHLLYGIKPVIIAIIALALWGLRRTALKGPLHVAVAAVAGALLLSGVNPLPLLYRACCRSAWACIFAPRRSQPALPLRPPRARPATGGPRCS